MTLLFSAHSIQLYLAAIMSKDYDEEYLYTVAHLTRVQVFSDLSFIFLIQETFSSILDMSDLLRYPCPVNSFTEMSVIARDRRQSFLNICQILRNTFSHFQNYLFLYFVFIFITK